MTATMTRRYFQVMNGKFGDAMGMVAKGARAASKPLAAKASSAE